MPSETVHKRLLNSPQTASKQPLNSTENRQKRRGRDFSASSSFLYSATCHQIRRIDSQHSTATKPIKEIWNGYPVLPISKSASAYHQTFRQLCLRPAQLHSTTANQLTKVFRTNHECPPSQRSLSPKPSQVLVYFRCAGGNVRPHNCQWNPSERPKSRPIHAVSCLFLPVGFSPVRRNVKWGCVIGQHSGLLKPPMPSL